jgi:hypothetical protein
MPMSDLVRLKGNGYISTWLPKEAEDIMYDILSCNVHTITEYHFDDLPKAIEEIKGKMKGEPEDVLHVYQSIIKELEAAMKRGDEVLMLHGD